MEAGVIKFILLNGVGHAYIDRTVTMEENEGGAAYRFGLRIGRKILTEKTA